MSKIFSSFVLVLFLIFSTFSSTFALTGRFEFYRGPFHCIWIIGSQCTCQFNNIKIGISLERMSGKPENTFILLGGPLHEGEVVTIDFPILRFETLKEAQRRVTLLSKKGSTFSKKTSYYTNTGFTNDRVMQILREKMTEASKTNSEKAMIDLTTFFVTELAKDVSLQKNPTPAAIILTIEKLADYARKGELADFLSFYFYLRAKHPEWLVSSPLDDSKKIPFPVHLLYNNPDAFEFNILFFVSTLEKIIEFYNDVIKTNLNLEKIIKEYFEARFYNRLEDFEKAYNPEDIKKVEFLAEKIASFADEGYLLDLDENTNLHSFIKRISSYIPNYMKFINNESVRESIKKEVSNAISLIKQKSSQPIKKPRK